MYRWRRTYPIAALLSLNLFCTVAVAKEQEALSGRGKTALGLSILSHEDAGVSIWRVQSTTMWGFEMDVSNVRVAQIRDNRSDRNITTLNLSPTLTIKRFRRLHGKVAQFSYQTIYGSVLYKDLEMEDRLLWSAGIGIGLGVAWFPWQRVSVSLRQGVGIEFSRISIERIAPNQPEFRSDKTNTYSFEVPPVRLLVLFHF